MTSSSGLLGNRQSVLNKITQDIRSVELCFQQAAEFHKALIEKQIISDEHYKNNCAKVSDLDNDILDVRREYKKIQENQTEALGLRDRLLQCKEGLDLKCNEQQNLLEKDSVVDKTGRRSRLIEWYEERLGLKLRRVQNGDVPIYSLILSHLSPHRDASATLRFCLQDRNYKFLGSNPVLSEDTLKRAEEQLNRTQDFQAFLCYIRREFSKAFDAG